MGRTYCCAVFAFSESFTIPQNTGSDKPPQFVTTLTSIHLRVRDEDFSNESFLRYDRLIQMTYVQ